ncbi:MAG: hypothetical protein LC672_03830 [Acidobacteria bacterium]|nr:hypothetical protein [Acidobacteriota bacterium]
MEKRQIRLADGRYLIFYTFEGELSAPRPRSDVGENEGSGTAEREPEAEEERGV